VYLVNLILNKRLKISETGDVRHCCFQGGYLGNILKTDILELWNGSISNDIRKTIEKGRLHRYCQTEACPFMFNQTLDFFSSVEKDRPYPVYLELDLPSTHCNIGGISPTPETACFMCPRAASSFVTYPDLTDEIIERIRVIIPTLQTFHISGIAESFWKNKIFSILDKVYQPHLTIVAYTNATLFNREVQNRYISSVANSYLSFSLDAASAETYVKVRRVKLFDEICSNIKNYVKIKPATHRCGISNNLKTLNIHEAAKMVSLADELGVRFINLTLTVTCNGLVENTFDKIMNKDNEKIFLDAETKARETAKKLGVELHFQRPFQLTTAGRLPLL
jgi:MoaA/NifB/PqqE/SkfB family radical SAM enzyme